MLKEGDKAPDFKLQSDADETVSLKDFKGRKVVLYFYPKDNTPGCTREAQDFRDAMPQIQARNAVVLGVSKDSVKAHQKFKAQQCLPFTLLSDPDGTVISAYDAWKKKSMYGKTFMGIERSTVIIDAQGRVLKHFTKVKVQGHVEEVLAAL